MFLEIPSDNIPKCPHSRPNIPGHSKIELQKDMKHHAVSLSGRAADKPCSW